MSTYLLLCSPVSRPSQPPSRSRARRPSTVLLPLYGLDNRPPTSSLSVSTTMTSLAASTPGTPAASAPRMTSQPGGVVPTGLQQNSCANSAAGGPVRRYLFPDPAPVHESRLYSLLAGQQQLGESAGELEGRVRHPLGGELGDPAPVHEGGGRHQSVPEQQKRAHAQHEDFQVGGMDLFAIDRNGKC
jgi:hypothetical protein